MEKFPIKVVLIGTITLGVTLAMGWGGVDMIINGAVKTQTRLIPGTDTWKYFEDLPVPIYLKIYIFNLTNPKEFANGEKAIMNEVGPYVYFEDMERFQMNSDPANDSVTYKQWRKYNFRSDLSNGLREDDWITQVNLPFFIFANILHEYSDAGEVLSSVDAMMTKKGEMITRKQTVSEWLFKGFPVDDYIEAANDTLVQSIGDVKLPESFSDGKYGLYHGRNGSSDGIWEIQTGRNKSTEFGNIKTWNEEELLPYWKNETCNMIRGTDGIIYPPFITNETEIFVYAPELCRSFRLVASEDVYSGVLVNKYRLSPDIFSSTPSAENWCFCQQDECELNGVINLSPCMEGSPIILSKPHFLGADKVVTESIIGLHPDPEKHETYVDVHPLSGLIFRGAKRFGFGLKVEPWKDMASFSKLNRASIPLFWSEEYVEIGHFNVIICWGIAFVQDTWNNLKYILMAVGTFMLIIGLVIAATRRESNKSDKMILIR